jgi:hypothetical protein
LVVFFIVKKQWSSVVSLGATVIVLNVFAVLLLGIRLDNIRTYSHFISTLSFASRGFDYEGSDTQLNQSINSFFHSFAPEPLIRPLTSVFLTGIILLLIAKWHAVSGVTKGIAGLFNDWEFYWFLIATAVVTLGIYSWEHHMVFLFPLLGLGIARITNYSPLSKVLFLVVLVTYLVDPFDIVRYLLHRNIHGPVFALVRYHGLVAYMVLLLISSLEWGHTVLPKVNERFKQKRLK